MPAPPAGSASARSRPPQAEAVRATLSDLVTISNPLDYHIFIWNQPERLRATFTAVMACGWDLACLVLDFPRTDSCSDADWQVSLAAWEQARDATAGRAAVLATLPDCLPESVAESAARGRDRAAARHRRGAGRRRGRGRHRRGAGRPAAGGPARGSATAPARPSTLDEWQGKQLLAELRPAAPRRPAGGDAGGRPSLRPRRWAARSWSRPSALASPTRASSAPLPWTCATPKRFGPPPRGWPGLGEALLVEPMIDGRRGRADPGRGPRPAGGPVPGARLGRGAGRALGRPRAAAPADHRRGGPRGRCWA